MSNSDATFLFTSPPGEGVGSSPPPPPPRPVLDKARALQRWQIVAVKRAGRSCADGDLDGRGRFGGGHDRRSRARRRRCRIGRARRGIALLRGYRPGAPLTLPHFGIAAADAPALPHRTVAPAPKPVAFVLRATVLSLPSHSLRRTKGDLDLSSEWQPASRAAFAWPHEDRKHRSISLAIAEQVDL